MPNISLAVIVQNNFDELLEVIEDFAKSPTNILQTSQVSLAAAWRNVFSPSGDLFEPDLNECLGIVSSNLRALRLQLEHSNLINNAMKESANSLLKDLGECIKIELMNKGALHVQRNLNKDRVGQLG